MGLDPRAEAVEAALVVLRERLQVGEENAGPDSHVVVRVEGAEDAECVAAFGTYLTGLVANVVGVDLQLADRLLGVDEDAQAQLEADVRKLIGTSNEIGTPEESDKITEDFRDD